MLLATGFFAKNALRRQRRRSLSITAAELLEARQLLTAVIVEPDDELDLVGRDQWGNWWASTPDANQRLFTSWSPYADWQHVLTADFDGDSFTDILGWDPASGLWWASLSDPVGSTTLVANAWSNLSTWSDVTVVDLDLDDDLGRDFIGRDQWGNWWGAIANGDGTFHNTLLTNWSTAVEWRDVTTFDLNRDTTTDIIGRTSDGNWWAAINLADGTFRNLFLARWDESAGWQDATVLQGFDDPSDGEDGDYRNAIVARTSWGAWWALSGRADGSIDTQYIGSWDESLGWRDVLAANVIGDYTFLPGVNAVGQEIVGRTSNGDWLALNPRTLTTIQVGHWNEAAGWNDVHVVTLSSRWLWFDYLYLYDDTIVGRTANGVWWGSNRGGEDTGLNRPPVLINTQLATWKKDAGWSDVFSAGRLGGTLTETSVSGIAGPLLSTITIHGHRAGTSVMITDFGAPPDDPFRPSEGNFSMTYSIPSLGFERTVSIYVPWALAHQIIFEGRGGADLFVNRTRFNARLNGRDGDDFYDALNGHGGDALWGGDGVDDMLPDEGDRFEQ